MSAQREALRKAVALTATLAKTRSLREGARLRRLRDTYIALAAKELAAKEAAVVKAKALANGCRE
jgi:hypothetical protein